MIGDLKINGKDALTEFGISMGDGFIDSIMKPSGMKDYLEYESPLEHGKQVLVVNPKVQSRELNLLFVISGEDRNDYLLKHDKFCLELQKGNVDIRISAIDKVFHLIFLDSVNFGTHYLTSGQITAKFCEPNPMNRE